ncbi:MAG: AsmA-like C-terminal region-containing protein [Verrucomicrobiota bacterium]|nr:AsmA-like C-terminal region-containing protein [Verrucomicrobiota bacterium]
MPDDSKKTRLRKRRWWRWSLRVCVVLALVVAGVTVYLNQVGLPGFAKRSLQARLAQRGFELDFDWLRMEWDGAWRAAQLRLAHADAAGSLGAVVGSGIVRPDYGALLSGRAAVREFSLAGFQLDAQLADGGTNLPPIRVSWPEAELRLALTGTLTATNLTGDVMGVSVDASLGVANAMAPMLDRESRSKPLTAVGLSAKLKPFKAGLAGLAKCREVVHFRAQPILELQLEGDATRPGEMKGRAVLTAGGATMPEGSLEELAVDLNLGDSSGITGSLRIIGLVTETAKIDSAVAALTASRSVTKAVPERVSFKLSLGQVAVAKAAVESVEISGSLARAGSPPEADESWVYWAKLTPYEADFSGLAKGVTGEKGLAISEVALAGEWRAPRLAFSRLDAKLYDGSVSGSGELDVATRLAKAAGRVNFSLHQVFDLLTPKAQRWIKQYQWSEAPVVTGMAQATLPEWTNPKPDWRAEVRPTLTLNGEVTSGPMSFRGIEVESARSDLAYSDLTWRLPNLVAQRPEGEVRMALRSHTGTQDFQIDFRSSIDPHAVTPALEEEKQKRGFDYFSFDKPPVIQGRVWGRWRERERTAFRATVEATNFTFRAQQVDGFTAGMSFGDGFLSMTNAVVRRPEGTGSVEGLGFNTRTRRLYLTNAVARLEPMAVARAIGPKTARALESYRFLEPPLTRVNGWMQTGPGHNPADLHFVVDGGPFRFSRFQSRDMNGEIAWRGQTMTLTNIVAEFYGGELRGDLVSRFKEDRSAELAFHLDTKRTELTGLMSDILGKKSDLSGRMDGSLNITANSNDWESWNGLSRVTLKDGYLWELPLIGIFSPVLDRLAPGLGASTFSEGTADFTITDSIVGSRNLELKSPLVRLQYTGKVDFEGRITKAGVVAEALRDTWVIGPVLGPLFNLALSPIERMLKFELSGTLNQPKLELKHIPKALLVPFKLPFKVFDQLVPDTQPSQGESGGRGP